MTKKRFSITASIYDKRGRLLSKGKNSYTKTHPIQKYYAAEAGLPQKQFLHAEIHAIIKCKFIKKAHKIVVHRYTQSNDPATAKPCKICMKAIKDAGIRYIEHT